MKKRILTILQYLLFLGLGIFLAWWSLKGLDHEKRIEIPVFKDFNLIIKTHFKTLSFKAAGRTRSAIARTERIEPTLNTGRLNR